MTLDIDKIIVLIEKIEKGLIEITNKIDGSFIGDKNNFLEVIFQKRFKYLFIQTFKDKDLISLSLPKKEYKNNLMFFVANEKERGILFQNIEKFKYIESIYIFDNELNCVFYANDNLEDVTLTLEFLK